MSRNPSCRCQCNNFQPFPDCFGCPVLEEVIPQSWVLDLADPLTLEDDQDSSGTSFDSVHWTSSSTSLRTDIDFEFQYPDLTDFGNATEMVLDPKAVQSAEVPFVECIWASNFSIYETEWNQLSAVPASPFPSAPCYPSGLVLPDTAKGSDVTQSTPWEYKNNSFMNGLYPQYHSPNRVRTIKASTPLARCGTIYCSSAATQVTCLWRGFGVYGMLKIPANGSGGYKFQLHVFFMPKVWCKVVRYGWNGSAWLPNSGETEYWSHWTAPLFNTYTQPGDPVPAYNWKALFPYAIAAGADSLLAGANKSLSGNIAVYEKNIDCGSDFDGSPVTLTLVNEVPFLTGSPSKRLLLGLSELPTTLTITPVY